MVESTH